MPVLVVVKRDQRAVRDGVQLDRAVSGIGQCARPDYLDRGIRTARYSHAFKLAVQLAAYRSAST